MVPEGSPEAFSDISKAKAAEEVLQGYGTGIARLAAGLTSFQSFKSTIHRAAQTVRSNQFASFGLCSLS